MTGRRRVDEIVEAAIGSREYTALHVSEAQATCENLAEALRHDSGVPAEFVELLDRVAGFEVRL